MEREALKWFKPAKGQFQLFYKLGAKQNEYQPNFVAETKEKMALPHNLWVSGEMDWQ